MSRVPASWLVLTAVLVAVPPVGSVSVRALERATDRMFHEARGQMVPTAQVEHVPGATPGDLIAHSTETVDHRPWYARTGWLAGLGVAFLLVVGLFAFFARERAAPGFDPEDAERTHPRLPAADGIKPPRTA